MRPRTTLAAAAGLSLSLALVLGACGDDDDDDSDDQSALCDARSDLSDDLNELQDLDLSNTTVSQLSDLLGDIGEDSREIGQAGSDSLSDEADQVTQSLRDLLGTIADLGSSDSLEDAGSSVDDALDGVRTSVENLDESASDSC
jgi:hypothetical protein